MFWRDEGFGYLRVPFEFGSFKVVNNIWSLVRTNLFRWPKEKKKQFLVKRTFYNKIKFFCLFLSQEIPVSVSAHAQNFCS